jgi:hypothetical protein
MLFNQTAVDGLPVVHAIETSDALLERCLYVFASTITVDSNVLLLSCSGTASGALLSSDAGGRYIRLCCDYCHNVNILVRFLKSWLLLATLGVLVNETRLN